MTSIVELEVRLGDSQAILILDKVTGLVTLPDRELSVADLRRVAKLVNKELKLSKAEGAFDEMDL